MAQLRQEGNVAFRAGNFTEALKLYSQALGEYSSISDEDRILLLSNRAITLRNLHRPQQALEDLNECIRRRPTWEKAHYQKALSLLEIVKGSSSKALLLEALHHLKLCNTNGTGTEATRNILVETESMYYAEYYPALCTGKNVQVRNVDSTLGKGVFSTLSVSAWRTVYKEKPLVSCVIPGDPLEGQTCKWCMRSYVTKEQTPLLLQDIYCIAYPTLSSANMPKGWQFCSHCHQELYCSCECMDCAWKQYHHILCTGGNASHPFAQFEQQCRQLKQVNPILISRMLAAAATRATSMSHEVREAIEQFSIFVSNPWPIEDDTKFLELLRKTFSLHKELESVSKELLSVENFHMLNGVLQRNASRVHPVSDLHLLINQAASYGRSNNLKIGGVEICIPDISGFIDTPEMQKLTPSGTALYAITNTINHSCDPNVALACSDNSDCITVLAVKGLEESEELRISYIDEELPCEERQAMLKEKYKFTCSCKKCQLEVKPSFAKT